MMQSVSERNNHKLDYIRILHLSDFHYPDVEFQTEVFIDKKNGYYSPHVSILNEVYDIIDGVDFILISGDFTTNAKLDSFEECLSFVCRKFANHKALVYAVFGNHDLTRGGEGKKFDDFLEKASKYPQITFCQSKVCEKKKLIQPKIVKPELDLMLINTCTHSSDKPIIPSRLKECVDDSIRSYFTTACINGRDLEKEVQGVWNLIESNLKKSTLIDGIFFDSDDYNDINESIHALGSFICLSHYNLVSFRGIDDLSSFFRDQGKFREILVNHPNTIIYLNGHTHTQECTVIENPDDYTNKLVCVAAPPLFKIKSSELNGFNLIEIVLKRTNDDIYLPVGCKIKQINNLNYDTPAKMKRIRFSKNITGVKFSARESEVIKALKRVTKSGNSRLKEILMAVNEGKTGPDQFDLDEIHAILMYLWWIGTIDEYSAMKRENESKAELLDYVGGVLCVPLGQ